MRATGNSEGDRNRTRVFRVKSSLQNQRLLHPLVLADRVGFEPTELLHPQH